MKRSNPVMYFFAALLYFIYLLATVISAGNEKAEGSKQLNKTEYTSHYESII